MATLGQRTSDFFTRLVRSWKFVIFQLFFISVWIYINSNGIIHFDPWPFDGLKLILTIEASFMGSMILMSQNRQSESDRKMFHRDFIVNWLVKREVDKMLPLIRDDHGKMREVLNLLKKNNQEIDKPKE